jgi:heme exporter protein CcmD
VTVPNPFTAIWRFMHRMGSPRHFYRISGRLVPWLGWPALLVMLAGLYGGLVLAPPDYQQGESYRIIFIHVPSAWMSLFVYVVMATAGGIGLVWRIKLADVVVASSAPVGASFTFLALVTGSLWGKPMWGTYWVWDARLTSELILLFLYLGVIGLGNAIEDRRAAGKACAVLALVGAVNNARPAAADGGRLQALLRRGAAAQGTNGGARARARQQLGAPGHRVTGFDRRARGGGGTRAGDGPMSYESLVEFLEMGGYAPYVWGSYGIFAIVMIANLVVPLRRARRVRERLGRELRFQRNEP